MSPSLDMDLFDYFRYIDQDSPYISRQFNIVSNISQGKMFKNLFYADNSYAIIVNVNNEINLFNIKKNWRELVPLRCIYTRTTNLDFYQMDKTIIPKHEELTIVELDVVMMLLQYRFWAKERLFNGWSSNPNVYVYMMLYPHFVNTMLDVQLFNRFKNIYYNIPNSEMEAKHPFHVIDYTNGIDNIYRQVQNNFSKSNVTITHLLRIIPTIYNNDMAETLFINNPYYTKQSEWSIWLSRIDYIVFLLDFIGTRGLSRNRDILYSLPATIKRLETRSTTIEDKVLPHMYQEFLEKIEYIKEKIGRR